MPLVLEIGLIIAVAALLGWLALIFRQPFILAYILAGVILGPAGLGLIQNQETIQTLSALGIAFLLFLIGLELDIRKIKEVGKSAILLGLGQIFFTAGVGYLVLRYLGLEIIPSLYFALGLTFASTIIVGKLLSEKKEINTLWGRLIIGLLLIQDLIAILALILLAGLQNQSFILGPDVILLTLLKAILIFFVIFAIARFVLPIILKQVASQIELLFLTALAWLFLTSALTFLMGFSIEIGAFLAGVTLASSPYSVEIKGQVKSLRDFFLTIFFVALGMQLIFTNFTSVFPLIFWLSVFVLIGHPLIVLILLSLLGFRKRTSFLAAIATAQISEFSLILVTAGAKLGHLSSQQVSLMSFVAIFTIVISTYLINYNHWLYQKLLKALKPFERKGGLTEKFAQLPPLISNHAVLFGAHRMGEKILKTLLRLKIPAIVVDFNPQIVSRLSKQKVKVVYGDLADPEVLEHVGAKEAKYLISTVPNFEANLSLLSEVKKKKGKPMIFVTAEEAAGALKLYKLGADYVIMPHFISGEHISSFLSHLPKPAERAHKKRRHILELKKHLEED